MSVKVTLNKLERAGRKQTRITKEACKLLEEAINHPSFKKKLNEAEFRASWKIMPGSSDEEKTAQEVLQIILDGQEYDTEKDHEIDLHIKYKFMWFAIGKTSKGKFPINTSYRFVNKCIRRGDPIKLAAHFMHEWTHVAGFYHRGGNGARGDVPYVVGNIVHEVMKEIRNSESSIQ